MAESERPSPSLLVLECFRSVLATLMTLLMWVIPSMSPRPSLLRPSPRTLSFACFPLQLDHSGMISRTSSMLRLGLPLPSHRRHLVPFFGYAAFTDTGDNFVYRLLQGLTTNTILWTNAISTLSPFGGNDRPEAQWDGIACATDINYCPTGRGYSNRDCGFTSSLTSRHVLAVTTDAPFSNDADI